MQNALGQSRAQHFYAFVHTKRGDLAEQLVENGLARLHVTEAKPVGLSHVDREWDRLKRFENEAKLDKRGGWGIKVGCLNARAPQKAKQNGADWFDQFFHPQRIPSSPTPEPETIPTVVPEVAKPRPFFK